MELEPVQVRQLLFGNKRQQPTLESIIMSQGSIEIVCTLDGIAALDGKADRAVALNMLLEKIKQEQVK